MNDRNVVTVKIYGQEYSISSEMSREYIMKVADYVDSKMQELGANANIPLSAIAVLTAINLADESFRRDKESEDMLAENYRYKEASEKYEKLWADAQKSLSAFKDQSLSAAAQRDEMQKKYMEKDNQARVLFDQCNELRAQNESMRAALADLTEKLEQAQSKPNESTEIIQQLQNKCRDIESSFFDLQMENIQLKNELERYKK